MTHGQGHKANDVFAPRGALQSGVSADFFALGYDAFGSLLPGRSYSSDSYRFGFGGMPKDDEVHGATGTSYDFGARLLDPRVGRWLSLDPLDYKYPHISPYVSFADNPIMYVDPDGKEIWIRYKEKNENGRTKVRMVKYENGVLTDRKGNAVDAASNKFLQGVTDDLDQLRSMDPELTCRMETLEQSKNKHIIQRTADGNTTTSQHKGWALRNKPDGSTVNYNPNDPETATGDKRDPMVGLAHELLGHSWDIDQGLMRKGHTTNGIALREVDAINVENIVRQNLGGLIRNWKGSEVLKPGYKTVRKLIPDMYLDPKPPAGQEPPPLPKNRQ